MTNITATIAELRELHGKATPGVWWLPYEDGDIESGDDQVAGMWDYEEGGIRLVADARFIAAAHNAMTKLLDELDRLRDFEARARNAKRWKAVEYEGCYECADGDYISRAYVLGVTEGDA